MVQQFMEQILIHKMSVIESVDLFFREGSSDKVYKASIEEHGGGHVVNFAYGRRGNALTTGTKTVTPVSLEKAQQVFNKLVSEKTGKGYVEDVNGKPFSVGSVNEPRDTGLRPQLLNEIPEEEVGKYINSDLWCAQEKYDGKRRMLQIRQGLVAGTNRKGLTVGLSVEVENDVKMYLLRGLNCNLDGEDLGKSIMIFDVIEPELTYKERYQYLQQHLNDKLLEVLKLVPTAWTTDAKRELYNRLRRENAEGIVFKKISSKYVPGRPNSGGDQLKYKFVASASCIVMGVSEKKRSIQVGCYDGEGTLVPVGSVTVYPNQEIPGLFDPITGKESIVEVKYLYYFPNGALFQPVLLGIRNDIEPSDCKLSKLKVKQGEEVE